MTQTGCYVLDIGGSGLKYALFDGKQLSSVTKINARHKAIKRNLLQKYLAECIETFKQTVWLQAPAPIIISSAEFVDTEFMTPLFPEKTQMVLVADNIAHTLGSFRNMSDGEIKSEFKDKTPLFCMTLGSGVGWTYVDKEGMICLEDKRPGAKELDAKLKKSRDPLTPTLCAHTFIPMLTQTDDQCMPTTADSPYGDDQPHAGMQVAEVKALFKHAFFEFYRSFWQTMPDDGKSDTIIITGGVTNISASALRAMFNDVEVDDICGEQRIVIANGDTGIKGAACWYVCQQKELPIFGVLEGG